MTKVDHRGCRTCGPHLSTYEDISNQTTAAQGPGWWFCSNPRTSPLYDEHGVVARHGKPCETNFCFDCVWHNVSRIEQALHYVDPDALITINDVGLDHTEGRRSMKALRRHLRTKTNLLVEDLYVLERYVERGHIGLHAHMYAHGDVPDEYDLRRAAEAVGIELGRSHRPVRVDRMSHHGNLTYFFKATKDKKSLKPFLDDNGGNLVNTTRGFWRVPGQAPAPKGFRGLLRQVRQAA